MVRDPLTTDLTQQKQVIETMPQPPPVLAVNDRLPIRTAEAVHSGKVRSVYWLTDADSRRLIAQRNYPVPEAAGLAIMVISDRLSAFDCIWRAEGGLDGVPGKGAALNSIAAHWFSQFREAGLARSHILEVPHPLVWVVQRAVPVRIEAIARRYITGSLWRAYADGGREFCGAVLPDGLVRNQRLDELLITPSTKGVISGLDGVEAADDANISRSDLERHWQAFGFRDPSDIDIYEHLLVEGFELIEARLAGLGQLFADTKFEFGYAEAANGETRLIYMDEVGTPDSSRFWDAAAHARGEVVENSKEGFRQALLAWAPDSDVLLNKARMPERLALAANHRLPAELFAEVSATYLNLAELITGAPIAVPEDPEAELLAVLGDLLGLLR